MEEVERRGLSGGIKLVRGLREEIRELDFTLNETKSSEALCRAKIKLIQSRIESKKLTGSTSSDAGDSGEAISMTNDATDRAVSSQAMPPTANGSETRSQTKEVPLASENIASGNSSAIALK